MKKTEKLLIDITFDLLYKKGFCGTSLMDILEIANMTKGAMYYHFQSKHALVLMTMTHYLEASLEQHWSTPLQESSTPLQTLIERIDAYYEMFADKKNFLTIKHGSPLNNFALDMSDQDNEFFNYLKSVYKRWQESIEDALKKAQDLQQTQTSFDAQKQSSFIVSLIEGSIGVAKAENSLETLQTNFEMLKQHIRSL